MEVFIFSPWEVSCWSYLWRCPRLRFGLYLNLHFISIIFDFFGSLFFFFLQNFKYILIRQDIFKSHVLLAFKRWRARPCSNHARNVIHVYYNVYFSDVLMFYSDVLVFYNVVEFVLEWCLDVLLCYFHVSQCNFF